MGLGRWGKGLGALALVGLLWGCGGSGDEGGPGDTPPVQDAPLPPQDTPDAGPGTPDAGPTAPDAGTVTGGALGWSQQLAWRGGDGTLRKVESAQDGRFVAWSFCLRGCSGDTLPLVSLVDRVQGFGAGGTPAWSIDLPRTVRLSDVEVSASGRVVLAGFYTRAADIGGGRLPEVAPGSGGDVFLLVLSAEGRYLWSRRFVPGPARIRSFERGIQLRVTADDAERIVLAGRWRGAVDLGGGPLAARDDGISYPFAALFDAQGTHVWSRSLKGEVAGGEVSVEALGTDAQGNPALGGTAAGSGTGRTDADWDTEGGEPYALGLSAADGSTRWTQRLQGTRGALTGVARTPDGGLAFAGSYLERGFTFAGQSLPAPKETDALLLAVTSTGAPRWARTFTGPSIEEQPRLVSDAQGHLTLSVVTDGTLNLGGETFVPPPRSEPRGELYLGRYDAAGNHVWSRLVGNHTRFSSPFVTYGIAAQPEGAVVYGVLMSRASPFEVDGRTFDNEGTPDLLLLQFTH